MPLIAFRGVRPTLAEDVFVAPGAYLIGDVRAGPGSNVWFGSVLRADFAEIVLGRGANVQDNCTLHTDPDAPCHLGEFVALGHNAIVHSATVEDHSLIGIGAIVLPHARIGAGSVIGANALVTEGMVVPPRSLVLGTPGRVIRQITDQEYEELAAGTARRYFEHAASYRQAGLSGI
jgi:carbonic anhydrase/acetyltransferase-like protein (isoleucine patch superfamily)